MDSGRIPDNPASELSDPDIWWWPDTHKDIGYPAVYLWFLQDIKNNSILQVPTAISTKNSDFSCAVSFR